MGADDQLSDYLLLHEMSGTPEIHFISMASGDTVGAQFIFQRYNRKYFLLPHMTDCEHDIILCKRRNKVIMLMRGDFNHDYFTYGQHIYLTLNFLLSVVIKLLVLHLIAQYHISLDLRGNEIST